MAWASFVPFILVVTFTVLNLFIAVVVSAMQSSHDERTEILAEIRELRREIRERGTGHQFR